LISAGALQVIAGNLTIGSVIGCSILSGRILTPISQIPSLMINWAHAKMSLKSLETYWNLPQEVTGENVSYLESFNGPIELRDIETPCFGAGSMSIRIPGLTIKAGERVGLVGSVGSGKSSILRLLAALTHPDNGYIQIDNIRVETLDRATISREIGYVAQEARLVSGTLRDNLLLGMTDPGEQAIMQACALTGMDEYILAASVKGLDTPINESGNGLSGGQKQLIHITRALLKKPSIFILDEPTASLDSGLEFRILNALRDYCAQYPRTIVIAASHRPRILELLDRLIVIHRGEITLDDAKKVVLERLTANTQGART
jgi:ATP-binding cassette subfamily C protein LapB